MDKQLLEQVKEYLEKNGFPFMSYIQCGKCFEWSRLGNPNGLWNSKIYNKVHVSTIEITNCGDLWAYDIRCRCGNLIAQVRSEDVEPYV